MNITEITNIIHKEVQKRGYHLEARKSISTNSWYFKISSGKYNLLFRVADHATHSNVITLWTNKNISPQSVEHFIKNRCSDLSHRKLKGVLGL